MPFVDYKIRMKTQACASMTSQFGPEAAVHFVFTPLFSKGLVKVATHMHNLLIYHILILSEIEKDFTSLGVDNGIRFYEGSQF